MKVPGTTSRGELNLRTGRPFRDDSSQLAAYQIEPWQNVVQNALYDSPSWREVGTPWVEYEFRRWNEKHPDNPVSRVELILYRRTLLGPGQDPVGPRAGYPAPVRAGGPLRAWPQ